VSMWGGAGAGADAGGGTRAMRGEMEPEPADEGGDRGETTERSFSSEKRWLGRRSSEGARGRGRPPDESGGLALNGDAAYSGDRGGDERVTSGRMSLPVRRSSWMRRCRSRGDSWVSVMARAAWNQVEPESGVQRRRRVGKRNENGDGVVRSNSNVQLERSAVVWDRRGRVSRFACLLDVVVGLEGPRRARL
jgi:hypothetical protein